VKYELKTYKVILILKKKITHATFPFKVCYIFIYPLFFDTICMSPEALEGKQSLLKS